MNSFSQVRNLSLNLGDNVASLGEMQFRPGDSLDSGDFGMVSVNELARAAQVYDRLTKGTVRPQVSALIFEVTGDMRAMDFYFPITNLLKQNEQNRVQFYNAMRYIANHANFNYQLIHDGQQDITDQGPKAVRYLLAGHLAEVFFYRKDMLDQFLAGKRNIMIYTTRVAFEQDGGMAGGDYNFEREAIQMELSRVFEGFGDQTPGVAPFLHELGHMLDHFDVATGRMGNCEGMLPGMGTRDGKYYLPEARQLFAEGKQIERERYLRFQKGMANATDPIPVGHPYVFQTDGEFIAGHLEMFFRNPNYFGKQNETLYRAFATVLNQDPRQYWAQDFPNYIKENQKAFVGGQRPSPEHITIPKML